MSEIRVAEEDGCTVQVPLLIPKAMVPPGFRYSEYTFLSMQGYWNLQSLLQPRTLNSIFLSKPSALNLPKHTVQVTNLISAPNHTEDSKTQQKLRSQKEVGASGKAGTHANTLSSWPDNTLLASRATLKGSSPLKDHRLIWETWPFLLLYLALSNYLLLYNLNTTPPRPGPLGSNATQTILPPVFTLRSTSLELFTVIPRLSF